MKYFLGVDPGIHGAIAVLQENGRLIDVFDMPITKVKVGAGFKTRIVEARLQEILAPYTDSVGWVERVSARPGQGVSSVFAFGEAYGLVRGVLAGLCIPTHTVAPAVWKKALRLGSNKESSRLMAMEIWPEDARVFKRVKDDGRAEAALLALYGKSNTLVTFCH